MPRVTISIHDAKPVDHAVAPVLALALDIVSAPAEERVHTIILDCQVQIEAPQRRYADSEKAALTELYGTPDRWSTTLRTLHWTHAHVTVPAFAGATRVDLHVPCTYDFNIAVTKYFDALSDGEVPIRLLFRGTIFYESPSGALQVGQLPWTLEATHRLPVSIWRAMMNHYYPDGAFLQLRRDVFDRLHRFKTDRGLPTWEDAISQLLRSQTEGTS